MTLSEALGPYAGPCAICGGPDKRHRVFDAIRGSVRAGDPVESVAEDYGVAVEAVRWIVEQKRFPRRRL